MRFVSTPLAGLKIIDTNRLKDERGSFIRMFCGDDLSKVLSDRKVAQINHSHTSKRGAIRGLHFQKSPAAEMKLVRCIRGEVFDVAVDIRKNSPTYLHWYGQLLSANNSKMMAIPEGYAHGFQTLQANSEMLYLHTQFYAPEHESGLNFADPAIKINWPLAVTDISDRDREHAYITNIFEGIDV
jgi:dTDP-4-dehydrorhamnose 3,5-epimerase